MRHSGEPWIRKRGAKEGSWMFSSSSTSSSSTSSSSSSKIL